MIRLFGFKICSAGLLVLVLGCGSRVDLNKAKSLVQTSLDSWKNGDNPSQLANQSIEVNDPDWRKGHKLLDYSIKSSLELPQQGPRVVVVLTIQEKGRKQKTTEVAYEVIVGEKSKISRDPFHIP